MRLSERVANKWEMNEIEKEMEKKSSSYKSGTSLGQLVWSVNKLFSFN